MVDVVGTHHPTGGQGVTKESLCWAACAGVFQFTDATLHLHCVKQCLITANTLYLAVKTIYQSVSVALDAVACGGVGDCRLTGQRGQVVFHRQGAVVDVVGDERGVAEVCLCLGAVGECLVVVVVAMTERVTVLDEFAECVDVR